MMKYKRLKDVFKLSTATPYWASWTAQGIFKKLKDIAPWGDDVNEARLNDMYGLARQNKILSPLAYSIYYEVEYPSQHALDTPTNTIAEMAMVEFGEKWSRLWDLRNTDYDPLENYRMTETGGDTNTRTGSVTHSDTGTVTDTHTGTDTLTKTGEETHTKSGTETLTKSGSETLTKSGNETLTKSGSETLTKSGTETLTKSGSETLTKSGSETHTIAGKETTTNTVTSNSTGSTNSIYGFNSATAVPSDTSTGTQTGLSDSALEYTNRSNTDAFTDRTDTTDFDDRVDTTGFNNRTDTNTFSNRVDTTGFNNRTDTTAFNNRVDTAGFNDRVDTDGFTDREDVQTKDLTDTQTRSLFGGDTYNNLKDTGTHTLSRYGNIGVTTSEQMATSQIELWQVFDFFQIVFKDIDSILLLDIY